MQSQNRIFDDIAKVAGGALGALGSLKQEIETLVRQRVDRFLTDRDLVSREEFEVVKAMASEARAEQDRLASRLATLEAGAAAAKTPASKADGASKAKKTPARNPPKS
jgi:BMFP domain-containing protein YqiC